MFVVSALVFGSSFVLTSVALDDLHPGLVSTLRVALGGATLALFPGSRRSIRREDRVHVAVLSLVWVVGPMTLVPIAQQWIDSGVAGMLAGAMPIAATVLASRLLRRRPRAHQMIGVAVGFVGVTFVSIPSLGDGITAASGVGLMILAVLCYAVAVNIAVPLQQRYGSLPIMARMLGVGTAVMAPYAVLSISGSSFTWRALGAVLILGTVCTAMAYVLMGSLVGRAGSTRASFVAYLVPVVALGLGVGVLGEQVAPTAVAGIVLVTAGAFLASRRDA